MKRILVIEDDDGLAKLIQRWHADCDSIFNGRYSLTVVSTLEQGIEEVAQGDVAAVILDLGLPDSPVRDRTADRIAELASSWPPILATSGAHDDHFRRKCLANGAADYMQKGLCLGAPSHCLFERAYNAIIRRELYGAQRP